MSKNLICTEPGGMPWTQSIPAFMQTGYMELFNALFSRGAPNANTAYVLSGMELSSVGSTTNISAGYFVYNGEAIRFPQQSYTITEVGNAWYVELTRTSVTLAISYYDGSTPAVLNDVTGVIAELVDTTPADATKFPLSACVPWGGL